MNNVNKTLYIPLYGKALVSKKGVILKDKKAEEIWNKTQFKLKGKSKSKWLAYYMGMRSAVFDKWLCEKLNVYSNSAVLHLGCGLDSRVLRVNSNATWVDVDFPSVISERNLYYTETDNYSMLGADITGCEFINALPKTDRAIVILEGVSMYLTNKEIQTLLSNLCQKYENLSVLVDCYTPFAAKISKIKNPINDVGVTTVYGVANEKVLGENTGLTFVAEREITPISLINELKGFEKFVFKHLYAGKISKKLYKLYEYEK